MQNFNFGEFTAAILQNFCIIFALFLTYFILKHRHPFINALKSVIPGAACLLLLNALGKFTGINIPINSANLGISVLLGIPGVGIITILNTLFSI